MDTKTLRGYVPMTNEEYHASPGYSKSHLDKIAGCPADYFHHYLAPKPEAEAEAEPVEEKKDGRSLVLGSAIHTAVLEPDLFDSEYVILPDLDLRTKAGRAERDAFIAAHPGATVLTVEERKTALACATAVRRHPTVSQLFARGQAERSYFTIDQETGELIKCRLDWFNDAAGLIVDLKSTDDASPSGFGKSAANFRYDLQPPWYQDVLRQEYGEAPPYWAFVAVEKKPPYKIGLYYPTPDQIEVGYRIARRDFLRILEHKRTGVWPDYGHEAQPLQIPAWARRGL